MAKTNEGDKSARADSTLATFHQVHSLIPVGQELLEIPPNTRVADALKLMQKHRYSQLPVVVGQAVLGVFSYRSFSNKALTRQKTAKGERLGELPVEDFLEEYEFVHGSQDWNHIVDYLNRDDAFFVGHPDGLNGLVTTMDVLDYFREVSSPFIVLAEIELSLRKVIQTSIPSEEWPTALESSLSSAYEGKAVPMELSEMTFDNYVQIISNNGNWRYFETFFDPGDVSRKQTNRKLKQLGDWRNIVFHIKRPLELWELETLGEHRAWLQRRMRAFEAKRKKPATADQSVKPKRGKITREKLLADSDPAAASFFDWLLAVAHGDSRHFAIEWHPVSFSIRLRKDGLRVGFAYGYAPDKLEIYFNYLDLHEEYLYILRRDLLAYGVFVEAGKHSLKAKVSEINDIPLRQSCEFLLRTLRAYSS